MMICPKCKNKGWEPVNGFTKPLQLIKTDPYDNFTIRYRLCLQCRTIVMTEEKIVKVITADEHQTQLFAVEARNG
jgi:hypothetical protein